ncbi:nucleoside triphosphate pyrophosphohydrolase [Clostridium sp. 'deep sea']|uniref:nucleoside triphosphate pyrophosphohydrolase n=1 Tax=Clostridium sp. 'deep sea' TaxID=2779445 RepID=UPI00189692CE|nr:nucleoside triphosphate pyrophosphohydrolase [Clostridium sp. 'deep sea']QOR34725.1 nucleoside triphosphate pyrophosphohydrolase [Clostridium sp. 'deep sea']
MIIYNKLIRDKIPQIIKQQGKKCNTKELNDTEYLRYLNLKLNEEINEYYESQNPDELADVVEVIYALLKYQGISIEEFETIRKTKLKTNGGFNKRLLLLEVSSKKG